MDYNSKINWMQGMELTQQTFRQLEDSLDFRQQLVLKTALGAHQLGLIPGSVFRCNGNFVNNKFEIRPLECRAVLPSGRIIDIREDVTVKIPILYGDTYYLAVSIGEKFHTYEREQVPRVRPIYQYSIYSPQELKKNDCFPLLRFKISEGLITIDEEFIPPCLFISENSKYSAIRNDIIEVLTEITSHSNLESGDGKRSLLHYLFLFKSLNNQESVKDFLSLTRELAQAVDYFIVEKNAGINAEIPSPDFFDVSSWLQWFLSYLKGAITVLDNVVLTDDTIDYEALLLQAKKELSEQLYPELFDSLKKTLHEKLSEALIKEIKETLLEFINKYLKPQLKDQIEEELSRQLFAKLFEDLYEKLYNSLYIAPEPEDDFTPMI